MCPIYVDDIQIMPPSVFSDIDLGSRLGSALASALNIDLGLGLDFSQAGRDTVA